MLASLSKANYSSPLFWAIIVGWIISVTLHEFAHGIVAYWGGDYTIRERGGLTLNPLQYANPVTTFLLPALFVLMGGIPLVGGATYIRNDLLRGRQWRTAVSLAGPFVNFLLFLVCAVPLHPAMHWVDPYADPGSWMSLQLFCGAMAMLQLISVFINLIPVPPLDGFGAIEPYLPQEARQSLSSPQVRMGLMFGLFFVLTSQSVFNVIFAGVDRILMGMGFDGASIDFVGQAYNLVLFGHT